MPGWNSSWRAYPQIVRLARGDHGERGQIAGAVQPQVQLNGALGAPKLRPVKQRHAQVDDVGIEAEQAVFETELVTVAVQTNGFGSSFQTSRNSSMQSFNSSTLPNAPRRIACSLNSPNQRSTRFSQLELVGTK